MEPSGKRIQIEYDDRMPLEPGQYLVKMMDDTGVEVTVEYVDHHYLRMTIGGMPVIFPVRVATPSGALVASLYDALMHAYRAGKTRGATLETLALGQLKEADDGSV